MATVLLADDDDSIRTVLSHALEKAGHHVHAAAEGATLMSWATAGEGDVVVTDVLMPTAYAGETGLDMLRRLRLVRPELPVIVISAQSNLLTAVKANQAGAFDYLPKPFDLDALTHCVARAAAQTKPSAAPTEMASGQLAHASMVGTSHAMQALFRTLARVVGVDLTVMIRGESGTGKELVARALHELSPRKSKPFVAVNMAAIPRELVESELFGYEKGAFTGAQNRKVGTFEQAAGGTVFLDEIGDMPLDAQTRLLRVLQQGEFTRVGGNEPVKATARIVCATHRDLAECVRAGAFREDLYFRLNVIPLSVPPLRERAEDVPALTMHFLQKGESRGLPHKVLSREAVLALQAYRWPGNVRELENAIYRLQALVAEAVIDAPEVHAVLHAAPADGAMPSATAPSMEEAVRGFVRDYFHAHAPHLPPVGIYDRILALAEKPLLEETLAQCKGNQVKAAELLGINRNTLRRRMLELGVQIEKA